MTASVARWLGRLVGPSLSIRTQLIAIFGVCLVPVAAVMLHSAQSHRGLLVEQAGEQIATSAHLHAAEQDHLVNRTVTLLGALRQVGPVRSGDAEACRAALQRVVADLGFLNGLGVSDAGGDKFCQTSSAAPVNLADRPFFRVAMGGKVAVGPVVVARTNGRPILPVAVPVLDEAGAPWRVITTGIPMEVIEALVRRAQLPKGADLTVADARGVVLASTLPTLRFGADAPWGATPGGEVAPGTATRAAWKGQLLGVATAHGGDLTVVASQPEAGVLAASDNIFARDVAVVATAVLVAVLLALLVGEFVLAKRLRTLATVAGRLARGELSARADLPGGEDEIGGLANAVNFMAASLETHIAGLAAREAAARHDAMHDPLTGLPNRSLLGERLAEVFLRCRRYGERAAIICVDLDRFKEVNDSLGHAAGDLLLNLCADRLRGCTRTMDTVARLGGDEFAVLQTDVSQALDVSQLCERLLATLAEPFDLDGHEVVVGASIGVALIPTDGDVPAKIMQNADIALYRAKTDGRGRLCFFKSGMDEQLLRRKALEADLRNAVASDQLEVHYQPQVDAGTGAFLGCEALLRWRHPERGFVPPAEFVPLAEETGLIVPIGEWVLRTACRDAAGWPGLKVSVNVSPVQFRQRDLVEVVERALREAAFPAARLELEITEGVLVQNTTETVRTLERLRALGVEIAMDDFGTGFASLSYLQRFPFDKLKIDRSFVSGLAGGVQNGAIVRAVVGLGRSLGMRTCAEGVETVEELSALREEGCEQVQGYLFGRPAPAPAISAMLSAAVATMPCAILPPCVPMASSPGAAAGPVGPLRFWRRRRRRRSPSKAWRARRGGLVRAEGIEPPTPAV